MTKKFEGRELVLDGTGRFVMQEKWVEVDSDCESSVTLADQPAPVSDQSFRS